MRYSASAGLIALASDDAVLRDALSGVVRGAGFVGVSVAIRRCYILRPRRGCTVGTWTTERNLGDIWITKRFG